MSRAEISWHRQIRAAAGSLISLSFSMTSSYLSEGGLSVAFHSEQAPFYYMDSSGRWKGLSIDYWNDISRLAGCNGTTLRDYEFLGTENAYEGNLLNGDIMNGNLFSTVMPLYFLLKDPQNYGYTQPAGWYRLLFLEKSVVGSSTEVASISFFIVFPLDVLLLFYASCKIIEFLEWCFKKSRSRRVTGDSDNAKAIIDASDLIRYALFSFSIVFLAQQWSGYFNGNNLLSIAIEGTPFFTMIAQFHQNKRQLVMDTFEDLFQDDEVSLLFGSNSSFISGNSISERFALTCEESSRVGLFQEYEYYEFLSNSELNNECKLVPITLGEGQNTGVGWLNAAMNEGRPYTYLIPKNGTRRIREIMDFALLTVYSEEKVENFLITRNLPIKMLIATERRKTNDNPQLSYTVVSLTQLQFPLVFLILGLIISLVGFILEWIYFACKKYCSCCQRFKCCR